MRPKGSTDQKKRKVKTILSGTQERDLIKDYEQGYTVSELRKKYNISKSLLSVMFKSRNIKKRIYQSIIQAWEVIENIEDKEKISGVYGICFINKVDPNDIKVYIGCSVDIRDRLRSHCNALNSNRHRSRMLYSFFTNENYSLVWTIIEKCPEELLLQRETHHIHEHNRGCLLNSFMPAKEEDIRSWLEKAITYACYRKGYTINTDSGCKESTNVNRSGYGYFRVLIGESKDRGQRKHFLKHRVAYWEKYGEYPELIRHKCNNKKCYNPDHLESGSYRDNQLDKRGDFPEVFEKAWVELNGDLVKISERFSDRWSGGQKMRGKIVSYAVYNWEKKLGLREKYPEILIRNRKRRMSHVNGNSDFPEIFEKAWVELNGDAVKLTERFSDRWRADKRADRILRGKMVSNMVYKWQTKLNLRKKYPEILGPERKEKEI